METLARVSMWLLVPSFLLIKIYDSDIPWGRDLAHRPGLPDRSGRPGPAAVRRRPRLGRRPTETVAAAILGSVVSNAGNFGIPVAHLLYVEGGTLFGGQANPEAGLHVQALVVMLSNLLIWILGYAVLAVAKGGRVREALSFFKLPMPYAAGGRLRAEGDPPAFGSTASTSCRAGPAFPCARCPGPWCP